MTTSEQDYEHLLTELTNLKKEYEENTVIQSMNDMKEMYDIQEKNIKKLVKLIDKILDTSSSIQLMLKYLHENINSSGNNIYTKYNIRFISDILESEILKSKTELYSTTNIFI
jgi:hypoxanthine phosphoribosyltransferase